MAAAWKRIFAIALALAGSAAAAAAPAVPDTPAGVVFGEWLASYNSADADRIGAFQRTYERETPVADVLDSRRETGRYVLLSLESTSPTSLVAELREEELPDSRLRFALTVEPGTPSRISALDVEALPPPRLEGPALVQALAARLDSLAARDRFSGAVLVAHGDELLVERAWGQADREAQVPNTVDTRFRVGSLNKIITAVAVLQLVEAGRLSLDAPIGTWLPDYPNRDAAAKVTVRHLLTHTGGVGEIGFNDSPEFATPADFIARREAMRTPADYVRQYGGQALQFAPGERTEYSSLGFMVLGRLVEVASGQDYYDYVQARVLDVAGMTSTGSLPESVDVPGRAVGYMRRGDAWVRNDDTMPWRGSPAGGGYTTVGDLRRFAQALQAGRLLSPAMFAEATRLQSGWQGFGFEVLGEGATGSWGHGGMAPGMNAHFRVYPQSGYVVAVLSNFDPPAAGLAYSYLHERLPLE